MYFGSLILEFLDSNRSAVCPSIFVVSAEPIFSMMEEKSFMSDAQLIKASVSDFTSTRAID